MLAFDGISPFHLSVPCLVFGEDWQGLGTPHFELKVFSECKGAIRSAAGFGIAVEYGLEAMRHTDIVIIPSWHDVTQAPSPALAQAVRKAHQRGAKIVGLCLGAFVLAHAGLLDGKRASTHWRCAPAFAAQFPKVRLDADVLYVDEGDVLTSAGTAAGLDCCLHLLRELCGAEVSNRVARRLVVAPHREGGQAQFIEQPLPESKSDGRLAQVLAWTMAHLSQPHSVDTLAERAAMSRRSFTRHFRQATGTSLVPWLLHQRLTRAQRLLETGRQSIEAVATEAGFGTALSLRLHFQSAFGTTPSNYRKRFLA
ncbi:MAG: helix-turn-helix domain-containing protein [Burkholderiaceae bacterium]|nr:helix-turn-helix domain-containing protein [Burkholderiaceae bacterium]